MPTSIQGKAVVVTGGGRGIGAAYVQHLAHLGAKVVVNDISQEIVDQQIEQVTASGGTAVGYVADISDPEAAQALIDTCVETYGVIDSLVNNAGLMFVGPSTDLDPVRIKQLFEVNVLGSIFCGVPAMRQMIAQGFGSIINVTSGAHMGLSDTAIYGASKGAIASLTYDWATDMTGTGVRVNAISPMAATQMAADVLKERKMSGAIFDSTLASFPTPEVNAPVVSYLVSDRSKHLNGQIIRIDGDELAVVSRPSIIRPTAASPQWTVDSIAETFDSTFSEMTMPSGLLQLEGDYQFAPVANYRIDTARDGNSQ